MKAEVHKLWADFEDYRAKEHKIIARNRQHNDDAWRSLDTEKKKLQYRQEESKRDMQQNSTNAILAQKQQAELGRKDGQIRTLTSDVSRLNVETELQRKKIEKLEAALKTHKTTLGAILEKKKKAKSQVANKAALGSESAGPQKRFRDEDD